MEFLEELGGDVTCDAKLTKLVHGGYDLHLDIARPQLCLISHGITSHAGVTLIE